LANIDLTRENVKKLKTEKRIGFVFSGLIIAFGALINLVIIVSNDEGGWLLPFLIALGIVGLSYFVAFSVNRKINKDLRVGKKEIKTEIVENKAHKIDYEVGSGVLYIPVLGDLFPKLWKPKMNEYSKYILTIKGVEYDVVKEFFENVTVGETIEIHNSKYSGILLEIKRID